MEIVNSKGQIKTGDKLVIVGKNILDDTFATAELVQNNSNGTEDVIIKIHGNKYFTTDTLLKGKSWANQVCIIHK